MSNQKTEQIAGSYYNNLDKIEIWQDAFPMLVKKCQLPRSFQRC